MQSSLRDLHSPLGVLHLPTCVGFRNGLNPTDEDKSSLLGSFEPCFTQQIHGESFTHHVIIYLSGSIDTHQVCISACSKRPSFVALGISGSFTYHYFMSTFSILRLSLDVYLASLRMHTYRTLCYPPLVSHVRCLPFYSRIFSAPYPSAGTLLRVYDSMADSEPTTRLS